MRVKILSTKFTDEKIINCIEEDYRLFATNNYAIHDYKDSKGFYELDVYLAESADETDFILRLQESYPQLTDFKIDFQNQEDWFNKWKQSLKPIWLTDRFLVDPSMDKTEEVKLIRLTPGMAFGTGYHETTRLAAELLEQYAQKGDQMLDLGCGSGILSIMGALLGCTVTAVDIDPLSIEATRENCQKNKVISSVTVMTSNLLESVEGKFRLICSNILYDVLVRLFHDEAKVLKSVIDESSTLIFSGLIMRQYDDFEKLLKENGFTIVKKITEGDWFSIAVQLKNTYRGD